MDQKFYDAVEQSPVIAAVKDMDGLIKCCELDEIKVIFILFGDICTIPEIVKTVKTAGRIAMVHMDLVAGLDHREVSVDYIKANTRADGIITTRPPLVKRAKEAGLFTVLRFFVIDSMAFQNVKNQYQSVRPDFIEILPGIMPKVIRRLKNSGNIPIIAGGLITDKEDVMSALDAGAISVSTTNQQVWLM